MKFKQNRKIFGGGTWSKIFYIYQWSVYKSCEACNRDVTFENVFKFEKYLSGKIVNLIGERAGCISFRLDILQNG